MIGHDFQTEHLRMMFLTDLADDLCQPLGNFLDKHLAPVLRAPDDMVLAGVVHIAVGLVGYLAHRDSIQHQVIYCQ